MLRKPFSSDESVDTRAVSSVIAVILMVAITVILAAVIATFVLGLGEQLSDTAPQTSFATEQTANYTVGVYENSEETYEIGTFTHRSGPTIATENLNLRRSDIRLSSTDQGIGSVSSEVVFSNGESISAGDTVSLEVTIEWDDAQFPGQQITIFEEGDRITLVFDNNELSATLSTIELREDVTVTVES